VCYKFTAPSPDLLPVQLFRCYKITITYSAYFFTSLAFKQEPLRVFYHSPCSILPINNTATLHIRQILYYTTRNIIFFGTVFPTPFFNLELHFKTWILRHEECACKKWEPKPHLILYVTYNLGQLHCLAIRAVPQRQTNPFNSSSSSCSYV